MVPPAPRGWMICNGGGMGAGLALFDQGGPSIGPGGHSSSLGLPPPPWRRGKGGLHPSPLILDIGEGSHTLIPSPSLGAAPIPSSRVFPRSQFRRRLAKP